MFRRFVLLTVFACAASAGAQISHQSILAPYGPSQPGSIIQRKDPLPLGTIQTAGQAFLEQVCANDPISQVSAAPQAALVPFQTVANTDYAPFGLGGMDSGSGSITVTGISGTVTAAYLYWHYVDGSSPSPPTSSVIFAGTSLPGTLVGTSGPACWGGTSHTFRTNVTAQVTGNGTYTISGLPSNYTVTGRSTNGVSLLIFYNDGNGTNNRDIYVYEGNDQMIAESFPGETDGWSAAFNNISYGGSGAASLQVHVADGQTFTDPTSFVTGPGGMLTIPDQAGGRYDGDSVPSAGLSRTSETLWDIHTFVITSALTSGSNNITFTAPRDFSASDCIGLIVAVVNVPSAAPTAAQAAISGRVTTAWGVGIPRSTVMVTDASGVSKYAVTNTFGYYTVTDLEVGATFILNARHRAYQFVPQVITVKDNVTGANIEALP